MDLPTKDKRVYCKNCRFFEKVDVDEPFSMHYCNYPKNKKTIVRRNWYSWTEENISDMPQNINANNDCKWFKPKNDNEKPGKPQD